MIEKNIRLQPHHARDLLVGRRSDGQRPGYQPPGRDYGGSRSSPSSSGGSGGGGWNPGVAAQERATAQASAQKAEADRQTRVAEQAAAEKQKVSMIAGPIQGLISQPRTEAPPGEKGGAGYISPEDLRKLEFRKIIAQGQEEKYDTPVDPNKFGETITKLDEIYSRPESEWTIDDKLAIEEEEKKQDWDKVKDLADRGESFDDIQKAMDKGLLMKEDAMRRQGLIERGLAAIMPKTKLESSLLGSLKKTFDPKRLATNFALRKMGLGWLNPFLGIGSFLLGKFAPGVKSKIASYIPGRKPTDTTAFKNLGLYTDRFPTTKQYTKNLTARETYRQPDLTKQIAGKGDVISKSIAKFTGKGDDLSSIEGQTAGLKDMSVFQIKDFKALDLRDKMNKSGVGDPLSDEEKQRLEKLRKLKESKVSGSTGTVTVAHGGRIDRPLMGGSRYI